MAVPVAELAAPRIPSREASRTPPTAAPGRGAGGTGGFTEGGANPHAVNALLAELKASHDHLADELRERAERAEAEARLAAGSPAVRAVKAWRAFLSRRKGP